MQNLPQPIEVPILLYKNIDLEIKYELLLNDLLIFPHNMDGFHIWEAGIVLSRFIIHNKEIFTKLSILELGTGVGIVGITALKYTKSLNVTLSDYRDDVLNNAEKNIIKNSIKHKHIQNQFYDIKNENCTLCGEKRSNILKLDWLNYKHFNIQYDIILGSDIIYKGAPLIELALLIKKSLKINGQAYILVPDKRMAIFDFIKEIEKIGGLKYDKIELLENKYYECAMEDEKKGFSYYPGLKELKFFLYVFTKLDE